MINRTAPEAPPELALPKIEIGLLDELLKDSSNSSPPKNNLSTYLTKIARLGGYLGPANDSPPGNTVMWGECPASLKSHSVSPSPLNFVGN
jgi:hypothetical protein